MNRNKIIFLTIRTKEYTPQQLKKCGVEVHNYLLYCVKAVLLYIQKGGWATPDSSVVIVMATKRSILLAKLLDRFAGAGRLIYYYRDGAEDGYAPLPGVLHFNRFERWTFDRRDARKHHMKFNPQFFCEDIRESTDPDSSAQGALFVGMDRGRYRKLMKIKRELNKLGIPVTLKIVADASSKRFCSRKYNKRLPYTQVLELAKQYMVILDIRQGAQEGLSLRVMEALFLQKKLITDNQAVRAYDFYHPDNIYILGIDDWRNIRDFLAAPYHKTSKETVTAYGIEGWLKRFGIGQEKL